MDFPDIEEGDICDYYEGVVHAVVKVLKIKRTDDWIDIELDPISWTFPECVRSQGLSPFGVGCKLDSYGLCWQLRKK